MPKNSALVLKLIAPAATRQQFLGALDDICWRRACRTHRSVHRRLCTLDGKLLLGLYDGVGAFDFYFWDPVQKTWLDADADLALWDALAGDEFGPPDLKFE